MVRIKVIYKGFELEVTRERTLGGWTSLFFSAFRIEDGWEMLSGFSESEDTVKEMMQSLKDNVDDYLLHPENWEDE